LPSSLTDGTGPIMTVPLTPVGPYFWDAVHELDVIRISAKITTSMIVVLFLTWGDSMTKKSTSFHLLAKVVWPIHAAATRSIGCKTMQPILP
jgi:hypothetical protein